MRYAVVGSRRRKDRESVERFVAALAPGDVVISGGCRGVDTWAVAAARGRGLETVERLPELKNCRRRWEYAEAYYARNRLIADDCDVLVAFVSEDRKGGTENAISHARKLGKKVVIMPPPPPPPRRSRR